MNIIELKEKCELSKVYKEYSKTNPDNYLYAIFSLFEPTSIPSFQLSYYSKKAKKARVFEVNEIVTSSTDDKIFGDIAPKELLLGKQIDFLTALSKAKKIHKEHYKKEIISKTLIILQHLDNLIWNITFFTLTFCTINIKIDATGEVLDHTFGKLFEFDKKTT